MCIRDSINGDKSQQSLIQAGTYLAGIGVALIFVLSSFRRPLRSDAETITAINAFLIRGCFWAVVLIGLVDAAISFLRVEGLLGAVVGEEMLKNLGRSTYRGIYVHLPLAFAGMVIGLFTRTLGFHWLALLIVIAELAICLLYTSPSPRDGLLSRMPSSA